MIIIVKYPVKNAVRIKDPWPIRVGQKSYFIEIKDDHAIAVGVRYSAASVEVAPRIEMRDEGPVRAHIVSDGGSYALNAEYDLRAWQAILVSMVFIDIDFDSPTIDFQPETETERGQIHVHSFSRGKSERPRRGLQEFAIYGRAFLGLDLGRPIIELMSLFREAARAKFAGRSIDAYNGFYLFLETQYCRGRTGTEAAADEFMKSLEFIAAVDVTVKQTLHDKTLQNIRFQMLPRWNDEPRRLVKEIIELRGLLRHHSLNSPYRWNPDRQEDYEKEATFLSLVAYELAFPKTSGKLWEAPLLEQFSSLAAEMHMTTTVHVRLTIKEGDHIRDVGLDLTFPQRIHDAQLAHAVLTKALEEFDQKSPGAELFGMRAWIKSKGTELFRYDLGSSLPR